MNPIIVIRIVVATILIVLPGCHRPQLDIGVAGDRNSQVLLVGADTFPSHMVGIWENQENGWILKFDEDGRITKMRHTFGRAYLEAGQVKDFPLIDDGVGFIKPGAWIVEYTKETNQLVVDISLDGFMYDVPTQGVLSGNSRDIFMGEAPQAGETSWTVQWICKPEYIATTADKKYDDYRLPFEAGDENQGEIVFHKLSPSNLDNISQ